MDYKKLSKASLIALLQESQDEVLHLKNVLDHLPGSIYWKDKNGVYLGHNQFASNTLKIMGYDWQGMVGKNDQELFPKEMAEEFRRNDIKVMEMEEEMVLEENTILPDGRAIAQLSTKRPFYNKEGGVAGVIGNTVNITRLKEIEVELKEAKEIAEHANQLKSQIIQNMEHDIRTPFAGILALTNLLCAREEDLDKREKLNSISECAQELLDYHNELIEIVELDTNSITSKPILFSVRGVVENLIKAERPAAIIRGLKIIFECDTDVPYYVLGDRVRLYRVLLNLLSNAIKFTKKGQVNIRVRCGEKIDEHQTNLIFEVKDTGIGIPKENQATVFDKFTRITPSNHGVYKGTGLGLYFVEQFVNDMKGTISLFSEVDKGSCFKCTIPFFIARQKQEKKITVQELPRALSSIEPHVLLIEDHAISQKVTKQVLTDCHCIVDAVDSGRDAIYAAQKFPYDLILVDIGLPDIDGFTVIETLKRDGKLNKETPMAILTAHSSNEYKERALEFGIDTFVVKPLTAAMVETLINEMICPEKITANIPSKRKTTVDGISFYYQGEQDIRQFHDIFYSGYYHFQSESEAPTIVDATANIGLSALYYKLLYPKADIICFEPRKDNFKLLRKNCRAHKIEGIELNNESIQESKKLDKSDNENIDLLKIEVSDEQQNIIDGISHHFNQIKELMITVRLKCKDQEKKLVDDIRKKLVPFYKRIKIINNPTPNTTRQNRTSPNPHLESEDRFLIYAKN